MSCELMNALHWLDGMCFAFSHPAKEKE